MTLPLHILARGDGAPTPMAVHPGAGTILKDEPRTLIWVERLADGADAVLKLYRRRPLPSALARSRALRDFKALRVLQAAGLSTTPPLFWARGVDPACGRYDLLATRWLPDATSLRDRLRDGPDACPDLASLFRAAARMHEAGLYHGALIPRNILVRGDPPEVLIMDTPRAVAFGHDIRPTSMARFDLLDLMQELVLHGAPDRRRDWLEAYGLAGRDLDRLLAASQGYRSTKRLRNRRSIETKLRKRLGL